MVEHFISPCNFSYFFYRLDYSNFIVNINRRDQYCLRSYGTLEFFKVQESVGTHRQVSHFESLVFEFTATVENALVLNLSSYDVIFLSFVKLSDALESNVV